MNVVITGASSGIGRALALAYAAPGFRLGLIGRDAERLADVAAACRAAGAAVETGAVDVTDRSAIAAWLLAFDDAAPIDLLVANAGIHSGVPEKAPAEAALEPLDDALAVVSVNFVGAMQSVDPVLRRMLARRRGHVALMSSLAAIRGFYCAPAYTATKAALRGWGDSLRALVAGAGVTVTVIHPGFVETPLDDRVHGAKYRRMRVERAARIVKRGLDRKRALIAFPHELHNALRLMGLLPPRWADAIMRRHRFGVSPHR
ncbi:MAG: SDR family NAD(P)-dependent oxidoreductase [Rhodospirillaceae bacterium]|nr:SDR family NAD(P)-dependent oxidoreductase [Rhodospirillaceae bacterium]